MRCKTPPVVLLCFFSLWVLSLIKETQARSPEQVCVSSCGDIQNISYPFRLIGDSPSCGDPDYELSCQNNRTVLEFHSGSYYVKRISYELRTIRVVDFNFDVNGTCNLPYHSLSSTDVDNDIRYRGVLLYKYASFMNCSTIITNPLYRRLPCLGGNTSHVYVVYGYRSYALSNLPTECLFLSMLPLDSTDLENPSYDTILNLLGSGFDLGWSVECRDCLLSNSTCQISSYELPFDYHCSDSDDLISAVFGILLSLIETLFIVIQLVARFVVAPVVILVLLILKFRKERKGVDKVEKVLRNQQSKMPKRYSYTDIMAMTNHFRDKLGQGGFGSVYKGQLPGGYFIAVKMLENSKFNGEEFINKVSTIGRIHHVNVVQLVGFCSEGSKRALVYEYLPNGSLDKHIFANEGKAQSFCWEKLLEIALGTAKGIEYLHIGCDVCILHFDIKPHNVLLDQNLIPKVADFGLAKFHSKECDFVSMSTIRGTIGYIAPELVSRNFGSVSSKSDVYSFGMLLLEMAGGRKNVDSKAKNSSRVYFPSWVYDHLNEGGGDLELKNVSEIEMEIARKLCIIGLWCIQTKASDRPSMTKVVEMLEGSADDLKIPPKPFSSSPQHLCTNEPLSESPSEWISESMEECLYGDSYVHSHQSDGQ